MKLSVIIPAYNAEKYIARCIESVLTNNSAEEVIVVDDGSEDGTAALVLGMAEKDKRIKLIAQDNAGPSIARRSGLNSSVCEYVAFIDSDDYLDAGAYDKILSGGHCKDFDIIEFGNRVVSADGKVVGKSHKKNKVYTGGKCAEYYLKQKGVSNFTFDKIYKKQLFDGVEFLALYYAEDSDMLAQLYKKARKVAVVKDIYYNYVQNPAGLTHKVYDDRFYDNIRSWEYIREIYEDCGKGLLAAIDCKICSLCIQLSSKCPEGEREKYKEVYSEHKKRLNVFKILASGTFKRKVMLILYSVFPKFTLKLLK